MTTRASTGGAEQRRRREIQRGRLDAAQRVALRRRLAWSAGALLAIGLVVAALALVLRPAAAAPGRPVPIEGRREHVATFTDIPYRNRPPSSGDHYDQPAGYGFREREVPTGNAVHTLEHGGIVVYYRPDLCDQVCRSRLRETYDAAPQSRRYPGYTKLLIVPYTDMDHAVVAAAWGWVDEMDAPDRDRLLAFYREHVDRGPEDAP